MDSKRFTGFGIMAAALAAAGVQPAVAAAAVVAVEGMLRFLLIESDGGDERFWARDMGYKYQIANGEQIDKAYWMRPVKAVDARSFKDLDMKLSSAYVAEGAAGWLSPEGVIWPCRYYGHNALASYVLGVSYQWLEENGWVHVDDAGGPRMRSYRLLGAKWDELQQKYVSKEPTQAQLKWLDENGHDIAYHGHGIKAKPVEMINVGGYMLDKKADEEAFKRLMAAAPKR